MKIKYKFKQIATKDEISEYFKSLGIQVIDNCGDIITWKNGRGWAYGLDQKKKILACQTWYICIDLSEGIDKIKEWIDKKEQG